MGKATRLRSLVVLAASVGAWGVGAARGQTVLFVDASATGAGDGSSWADAFTSVQPALDASTNGGQVWVAAGRYVETITLQDGVALYGGLKGSEDPATFNLADRDLVANRTILDGEQAGTVVTVSSGATTATRIDGFTITDGVGGLYVEHSSLTIANNTITANNAGGISLAGGAQTVANNTITGNTAVEGGGLYLFYSSATIVNNTIAGNYASTGGGLYVYYSAATIVNNKITGNSAFYSGGGLYVDHLSSPTIANNAITGNSAESGGGLYVDWSSPTLTNNTIAGNGASDGGGLYLRNSSPTIANTIVAFNSSGLRRTTNGTSNLRHNCVYGNTDYNYSGITDPTGTNGNISAEPRLADLTYGNWHIQPDSPCAGAGTNGLLYGDHDLDGQPRILPEGGTVDIGADESDGTVWPAGPYVIVRVSPAGDDNYDGSSWFLAKRTVQGGIDQAFTLGGEVWVQAGTYAEQITLHPYAYLYGGFLGREEERYERDWRINVTTLDGQQRTSAVTARAGWGVVSTIDGFTIVNGSEPDGGGLCVHYSSPTIVNNTITGNSANSGGGLYLAHSASTVASNTFADNDAPDGGGGLYVYYSSPTIVNNTITGNSSYRGGGLYLIRSSATIANNMVTGNSTSAYGGGLYVSAGSPMIMDNTIAGNSASGSNARGGGLYLTGSSATISRNTIKGNSAGGYGLGGGLYLLKSSPTIANGTITHNSGRNGGGLYLEASSPAITNSTIAYNSAEHWGGGLYVSGSSPTIANNLIAGNSAGSVGGGLYSANGRGPTIVNNTITGNNTVSSIYSDGGALYLLGSPSLTANNIVVFNSSGICGVEVNTNTLRRNCVYGNAAYNYRDVTDPTGSNGNISADPLFVQYPGDVRLSPASPCVDAGSNGLAEGDFDLDGQPRIVDGDYDGTAVVDMGAYEYYWAARRCDLDGDDDVDRADYAAFRAAYGHARGQAEYDLRCDYDHSGTINLRDYQAWLACYRDFVGDPRAVPPPLPCPEPDLNPQPTPRPVHADEAAAAAFEQAGPQGRY